MQEIVWRTPARQRKVARRAFCIAPLLPPCCRIGACSTVLLHDAAVLTPATSSGSLSCIQALPQRQQETSRIAVEAALAATRASRARPNGALVTCRVHAARRMADEWPGSNEVTAWTSDAAQHILVRLIARQVGDVLCSQLGHGSSRRQHIRHEVHAYRLASPWLVADRQGDHARCNAIAMGEGIANKTVRACRHRKACSVQA